MPESPKNPKSDFKFEAGKRYLICQAGCETLKRPSLYDVEVQMISFNHQYVRLYFDKVVGSSYWSNVDEWYILDELKNG